MLQINKTKFIQQFYYLNLSYSSICNKWNTQNCKFNNGSINYISKNFSQFNQEPLGDQKVYYKLHLQKKLKNGHDTHFNIINHEKSNDIKIKGFGKKISGFNGRQRKFKVGESLKPVNFFSNEQFLPINCNFYKEHFNVSSRSEEEIQKFLQEHEIKIDSKNEILRPVINFNETGFPKAFLEKLNKNYNSPTPIQSISWPYILSGHDLISIGRTGSGKTIAFILPAIIHSLNRKNNCQSDEGPFVIVLCPTRELAQQVEKVTTEYAKFFKLKVGCLFGGISKTSQNFILKRGVDICIATPGRTLDFLEQNTINLKQCTFTVLDEADRMLDMGFEPQIRKIFSQIRPNRQTLMFSATWPKEIRALASEFQENSTFLNIGSTELSANNNIKQTIFVINEEEKIIKLFDLLKEFLKDENCKTLIFVETKRKADVFMRKLRLSGFSALSIHGDKSQTERNWVLSEFRLGNCKFLIATDVAARGLDVEDIKYVINVDYPFNTKDYIHRIGRTGRGNNKGYSYTFFTNQNKDCAKDLINILQKSKQEIPDDLKKLCEKSKSDQKIAFYENNKSKNYRFQNKNLYRKF